MRNPSTRPSLAALLLTALLGSASFAQVAPGALFTVPTDPTEFGSLRMDPFEAVAPADGEWIVLLAGSYFNQWNGTWHTRRVHEDFNLHRQPIEDREIDFMESAFPDDEIYRLDIEGSRIDLLLARGFRNGTAVSVRLPWITVGSPGWDSIAEAFHQAIPVDEHYVRDLFPRGQTFLYLKMDGRSVVARDALGGSGIGDVALTVAKPFGERFGLRHRVAATVELPTGKEGSLHGSGGWDVGVRWFGRRTGLRSEWLFGAGLTRLDRSGSLLGFARSDTAHLSADYVRRISGRTALRAGARLDSSPLAGVTSMNLGDPVLFYRLGAQFATRSGQWIALDLGEEIAPQMGVDADFSLHLGYGWSLD